jgi:hypothetical protein
VSAPAEVIAAATPPLAAHAVSPPPEPRFHAPDPDRAFVLEAVHEGFLMHYRRPRLFAGLDEDLELLGGDALYALGLARLADRGDVAAVAELADLIALCARAEAAGRPDLADEAWEASAALLAHGEGAGARAAVETRLGAPNPLEKRPPRRPYPT